MVRCPECGNVERVVVEPIKATKKRRQMRFLGLAKQAEALLQTGRCLCSRCLARFVGLPPGVRKREEAD